MADRDPAERPAADSRTVVESRVLMMYRPIIHVTDLDESDRFFSDVFGRPSKRLDKIMREPPRPGHAIDYSSYVVIRDLFIDSFDPKLYITDGLQRYPTVATPRLKTFGWYVDDMEALFADMRAHGFGLVDVREGKLVERDEPPKSLTFTLFHSYDQDAGLRYHFFPLYPFPADPRLEPGWTLPPVSATDPLGIECASHHTVLTRDVERARRLAVDVLGGKVIHAGRDEVRGATGIYVYLGGSVIEYAVPDRQSAAGDELATDDSIDTYSAITWKVADLDRVQRHLDACGVRTQVRSETVLVTDPATSLGVPWGFATELVHGDPRRADQPAR